MDGTSQSSRNPIGRHVLHIWCVKDTRPASTIKLSTLLICISVCLPRVTACCSEQQPAPRFSLTTVPVNPKQDWDTHIGGKGWSYTSSIWDGWDDDDPTLNRGLGLMGPPEVPSRPISLWFCFSFHHSVVIVFFFCSASKRDCHYCATLSGREMFSIPQCLLMGCKALLGEYRSLRKSQGDDSFVYGLRGA